MKKIAFTKLLQHPTVYTIFDDLFIFGVKFFKVFERVDARVVDGRGAAEQILHERHDVDAVVVV